MFNKLMDYANKKEMRESRDEVVVGQMIASMARLGYPTIAFNTGTALDTGFQAILFSTPSDPVLHTVQVTLDRKTGGGSISEKIVGSKATLTVTAEVKNYIADPDDLLAMWRTDFANIGKMPMMGQVKLDHRLNSILAKKSTLIELSDYDGPEDRERIDGLLHGMIGEVRQAVAQYKRHSPFEQDI
ncbi:MAG: hypothetical protein V9E98_07865 [Candidatus Nanopelagicales bacterium]